MQTAIVGSSQNEEGLRLKGCSHLCLQPTALCHWLLCSHYVPRFTAYAFCFTLSVTVTDEETLKWPKHDPQPDNPE
jgi:hypothetical protein